MGFIKKQRVGFYASALTAVLALIGMIIYVSSIGVSRDEFYVQTRGPVIALVVVSIVALAALVALSQLKFDGIAGKVTDAAVFVLKLAVAAMLCSVIGLILRATVDPMSQAYLSDFRNEDAYIFEALGMAIGAIVLTAIAAVSTMVGSFFKVCKTDE